MQQPNIRLMKTPQNSTYNAVPASRTHHDYNRESEISDRDEITHIFFQIFSQEAKTNTKTSGSNYLQDSFSYHFWKLAVILDRLFILETTTAVSKQIALSLRQMPRVFQNPTSSERLDPKHLPQDIPAGCESLYNM